MGLYRESRFKEGFMPRRLSWLSRVAIEVGVLVALGSPLAHAKADDAQVRAQLAGVRLPFILNQGHTDARVAFYAPTFAGTLFVTRQGDLVYSLPGVTAGAPRGGRQTSAIPGWTLTERLRGARVRPVGQEPSATGVSCFLGNDPARWRPAVPAYDQLGLGEVWPGVAVSLRVRGRSVEKVFTVKPGGSVARIRVRVGGASTLAVDRDGALVARTGLGPVSFTAPVAYQEQNGVRRPVAVTYRITGREYGFTAAAYDPTRPLVIDPLLQSTYLGGGDNDGAVALAIHPTTGDVYVAGIARSSSFPGTAGGAQPGTDSSIDAFVARLPSTLTSLTQATYLGGSAIDVAAALAIHPATGDVYVAGTTESSNFPGTAGGAQPVNGGFSDAFVARLPSTLTSITQTTYLGGRLSDRASDLAIHPTTSDVYVAGSTTGAFPGTTGGAQSPFRGVHDAFVARLPSTLTSLTQATYVGGSFDDTAEAMAIHPTTGDVYVAGLTQSSNFPGTTGGAQPAIAGGNDAFVARLPSTLTTFIQSTYLGGSAFDTANALAIHPTTGDVYVAGYTESGNFPGTAGGAQPAIAGVINAFVARLPSTLTTLTQATYLGGSGIHTAEALAIHPTTGDVYVACVAQSSNFPGTTGGAQPGFGGGGSDAVVARLPNTLTSITQATYLGGSNFDSAAALVIHPTTGDVYVAGATSSDPFPGTAGGAQPSFGGTSGNNDAFVARLTLGLALQDPTLSVSASVNQPAFAAGQRLSTGGSVTNPGLPQTADFYVGILRPDGSIQFFTNSGIVLGNVANLASFQPLAVGVPLGTAFSVAAPGFYMHEWAASEQHGSYVFFVAAVKAGALAGGILTNDKILGLATASFSFP
jgi:hypothetical protein